MTRSAPRRIAIAAAVLVPVAFAGLFAAALVPADDDPDRIPAAIVNDDELVNQTAADGTETPVFAGRQLVTELTGSGDSGFDWTITNADDAEDALESGEVYAVLTVPDGFSESILSLQSDEPRQAEISIRTDDAHSYLTSTIADTVGQSMATSFGREITEQYLAGVYSSIGGLGESLGTAADGADELAGGAGELGAGLGQLATGTASAQSGASELADGVGAYTGGVRSLSGGLQQLNTGARGLTQVSQGVTSYTGGVSQLAAGLAAASASLSPADPAAGAVRELSAQLSGLAAQGGTLSTQTSGAIQGVQSGISQSASGASRLAGGSTELASGATSLADGLQELSTGATDAASGATELSTGATQLADGLRTGADQVPAMDTDTGAAAAAVVADPVTVTVERDNEVSEVGRIVSTLLVPLGLWIGALATFLVLRPVSRSALASTAGSGAVIGRTLARASAIASAQAVLLVALLHLALGVAWSSLPATLGFSLVMALAFTAFHHLLTVGFGRAGLVISLFLLAVQLTSTGGLYPIELVAGPLQAVSPLLPLTYGVSGMQAIITGTDAAAVVVAVIALAAFGAASVLLSLAATRRLRRARSLGLVPAAV